MRDEVKEGVADQCADAETKHHMDDMVVRCFVTELGDEQSTERDHSDDKHCSCTVAVHCNVQKSLGQASYYNSVIS